MTDSTGARLRALLLEACGMLKVLDRQARYPTVTDFLDRALALLLVSESHQQIGCENDMPWELCIDCKAKQAQSVSESHQQEQEHEKPLQRYTPGGEWWDQMVEADYGKWVRLEDVEARLAAVRTPLVTESHPSDRLRELAYEAAWSEHDFYFHGSESMVAPRDKQGHEPHFDTCPHSDCVLVRASQPSDGWQDISTAPKDATRILLHGDGGTVLGDWSILPFRGESSAYWRDDLLDPIKPPPTHWQPLPAPPSLVRVIAETTREGRKNEDLARVDGVPSDRPMGSTASSNEAK